MTRRGRPAFAPRAAIASAAFSSQDPAEDHSTPSFAKLAAERPHQPAAAFAGKAKASAKGAATDSRTARPSLPGFLLPREGGLPSGSDPGALAESIGPPPILARGRIPPPPRGGGVLRGAPR